jgi:subtilisin family serine protease
MPKRKKGRNRQYNNAYVELFDFNMFVIRKDIIMKNKLILSLAMVLMLLSLNAYSQSSGCPSPVPITNDPVYNVSFTPYGTFPRYALDSIFAYCAWTITKGDPDIIVGVVDLEFDTLHEDMRNTFESVVGVRTSTSNHGTGVSSLVASGTNNGKGMAGIGYNTRVRGYHASEERTNCGIYCVWEQVKQAYRDSIKIISVSCQINLPGYSHAHDSSFLQQMLHSGVVLIVSAGNDSAETTSHKNYANIPGVINVSCVDRYNRNRPTNTARNAWVDVCATSAPIMAAVPRSVTPKYPEECSGNSVTGWYCLSGNSSYAVTSHATPQVAGTVALMRSVNSFLSSAEIENIIKTTGDPIKDDSLFKGRTVNNPPPKRVNAYKAVKRAKELACGTTNTFSKTINKINESVNGGNVIISNTSVASGKRLSVRACNSVNITGTFTVESGGALNINVIP